jgi:hypothetical protein
MSQGDRKKMVGDMPLQIVKDGQLQGWFTGTVITVWLFFVIIPLAILFDRAGEGFNKIGGHVVALYLGQLTIFFGARVAQNPTVQAAVTKIFNRARGQKPEPSPRSLTEE